MGYSRISADGCCFACHTGPITAVRRSVWHYDPCETVGCVSVAPRRAVFQLSCVGSWVRGCVVRGFVHFARFARFHVSLVILVFAEPHGLKQRVWRVSVLVISTGVTQCCVNVNFQTGRCCVASKNASFSTSQL